MWYFDKKNYILTLPKGCCTVRELMGKEIDGVWTYAIVQYKDGRQSLVFLVANGQRLNIDAQ